jgi:putative transposase
LSKAGLQVAPSTYYAARSRPPSARARRGAELRPRLVQLWDDNYRVYGARKLWKAARRAGHDVGRDQVARLMREAGIEGVRRTKRVRTTKADPLADRPPVGAGLADDVTRTDPCHQGLRLGPRQVPLRTPRDQLEQ